MSGLALLAFSFTAPMKFEDSIVSQTVESRLKVAQIDIELKTLAANTGTLENMKLQNEIRSAHSKIYHEELAWLDNRRNRYHTLGFWGAFSGISSLFVGLMVWITSVSKKRIQRTNAKWR
jgi:hypothetical protein